MRALTISLVTHSACPQVPEIQQPIRMVWDKPLASHSEMETNTSQLFRWTSVAKIVNTVVWLVKIPTMSLKLKSLRIFNNRFTSWTWRGRFLKRKCLRMRKTQALALYMMMRKPVTSISINWDSSIIKWKETTRNRWMRSTKKIWTFVASSLSLKHRLISCKYKIKLFMRSTLILKKQAKSKFMSLKKNQILLAVRDSNWNLIWHRIYMI